MIIASRNATATTSSIHASTLWIVVVGLALSITVNSFFNMPAVRQIPHFLWSAWMLVTLWHTVGWYSAPGNRGRLTFLHYTLLAMVIYLPISAATRDEVYGQDSIIEISRICLCLLGYFFFFAATRSNALSENMIKVALIIMIPILLLLVFRGRAHDHEMRMGLAYAAGGHGYECMSLMPWILLLRRSWVFKWTAIALCAIGVLVSLKRAMIVGLVLGGGGAIAVYLAFLRSRTLPTLRETIGMGVVFAAFVGAGLYQYEGLSYRFASDSSGRTELYEDYWNVLQASSWEEWCFGHGCRAGQRTFSQRAHNDWLHMWFEYGVIGAVLLTILFLQLVRQCADLVSRRWRDAHTYCFCVIVLLLMSIFTGGLALPTTIMYFSAMGAVQGGLQWQREPRFSPSSLYIAQGRSPERKRPACPQCGVPTIGTSDARRYEKFRH